MIWGKSNAERDMMKRQREMWHDWFAWYPVELMNGRIVWLETVRRIGSYYCGYDGGGWTYKHLRKNKKIISIEQK